MFCVYTAVILTQCVQLTVLTVYSRNLQLAFWVVAWPYRRERVSLKPRLQTDSAGKTQEPPGSLSLAHTMAPSGTWQSHACASAPAMRLTADTTVPNLPLKSLIPE